MYVVTINRVNTHSQIALSICGTLARGQGQDGHIHIAQLSNIGHHVIPLQFSRLVFRPLSSYNACHFKVVSCLQRLQCVLSYIAITHYGCSNLFHIPDIFFIVIILFLCCRAKKNKLLACYIIIAATYKSSVLE